MHYEGTIYRPPSEAHSLLVQVTVGCTWNKCTFCDMYKDKQFHIRRMEEIREDLIEGTAYSKYIRRIFLCDGDAIALPMDKLEQIFAWINELYPMLEAVRIYASARDILRKKPEELRRLRGLGMDMVYIGLESGSDKVLAAVNKGITKAEMIEAAAMLRNVGIKQSISIISGLGGEDEWEEHIRETADALNQMRPEFLGMLVLHVGPDSNLRHNSGCFRVPSPGQVLREMSLLIAGLELEGCYFTSAHVSNYVNLAGTLSQDKHRLLTAIDGLLADCATL